MGTIPQSDDWKPIAYGRKRDRAVLTLAPLLAVYAVAFLFGQEVAGPGVGPLWQIPAIIGCAFLTVYAHNLYKSHVKGGFAKEVARSYLGAIILSALTPPFAIFAHINGYAAVAAAAGYLLGFTWSRFGARD